MANYVETEQILSFGEHQMTFFQVRGSIPVYWSQPGYKYRPPPRIDRGNIYTQIATVHVVSRRKNPIFYILSRRQ